MAAAAPAASANLRGELEITVHQAADLYDVESFGKQDPYCIVHIDNERNKNSMRRTNTHDNGGRNPVWGEGPLQKWILEGKEDTLEVKVMDAEVTVDRHIAAGSIPLKDLINADRTWYKLIRNKKLAGTIQISAKYVHYLSPEEKKALEDAEKQRQRELEAKIEAERKAQAEKEAAEAAERERQRKAEEERKEIQRLNEQLQKLELAHQADKKREIEERQRNQKALEDAQRKIKEEAEKAQKAKAEAEAARMQALNANFRPHAHKLQQLGQAPYGGGRYACVICQQVKAGAVFHCSTCKYDECTACYPKHSGQPKRHEHPLVKRNEPYGARGVKQFICDLCKKREGGVSNHCNQCSYDECPACFNARA